METREDAERLITWVMENAGSGRNAWFVFNEDEAGPSSDSTLMVAMDREAGYGGLVWCVSLRYPKRGGIYACTWVTDNPSPPEDDPKVISDAWTPVFMEPATVLPLPEVRKALEEFCREGTGDRPTCVGWVKGHLNGSRVELGPAATPVPESSTDWDSVLGAVMERFGPGDLPRE
ncbi:Imm1 family immunity protein [Kitasatospora sp. NPDC004799]|uniref:Imm1 family immunity protein n=1 Tax=Kitasatospora sp. NPDC004799 TaxID=3154460 RepID=UPI0033B486C5